jgi:hypothetical protein
MCWFWNRCGSFSFSGCSSLCFKKYAKDKIGKVEVEANVYQILGDSHFFSTCFASRDDYLILGYEEGKTLFDCVLQGIHIPKQVINDVEDAREYVRMKGLNPLDFHLKNILLQNRRAKILDVSEYMQSSMDYRWEHLKRGYEQHYHLIDGKPISFWLLETIRKRYNRQNKDFFSYEDFIKFIGIFLYKK